MNIEATNTVNSFAPPQVGESAMEIPTEQVALKEFRKVTGKRKVNLGANEGDVEDFILAVNRVSDKGTFSINEVMRETRAADMDPRRVVQLFATWIDVQLRFGRVTKVNSCYDHEVFVRV